MVGLSRFELLTPRLSSVCSNQLSYRPGREPVLSKLDRRAALQVVNARSIIEKLSAFSFRRPADALGTGHWQLVANSLERR
jgi:hypothetical protein